MKGENAGNPSVKVVLDVWTHRYGLMYGFFDLKSGKSLETLFEYEFMTGVPFLDNPLLEEVLDARYCSASQSRSPADSSLTIFLSVVKLDRLRKMDG